MTLFYIFSLNAEEYYIHAEEYNFTSMPTTTHPIISFYPKEIAIKKLKIKILIWSRIIADEKDILEKSGVYMLSCKKCDKAYLRETGHQYSQRFQEHKRVED